MRLTSVNATRQPADAATMAVSSVDGARWQQVDSGTHETLRGVAAGHGQFVAEVARVLGEQRRLLAAEQAVVEVAADRELRVAGRERKQGDAQVGHDPSESPVVMRPGAHGPGRK